MKTSIIFITLPVAATSFVVHPTLPRAPSKSGTSVRSSWENQQQFPEESQGYQQYSGDDQQNQEYVDDDQVYEQYYELYAAGNQGGFQQEEQYSQQTQEQYATQDQSPQQYQDQNGGYNQYMTDGNQYAQYDANQAYQQEAYAQQQEGYENTGYPTELYEEQGAADQGLVLDGLDQELSKMSSKYGFTESDYLAAARRRAELKVESTNSLATDEEWQQVALEKKQQMGEIDDWENAAKEAGNTDSQILMFTEAPADGDDDEEGEPKLLLF